MIREKFLRFFRGTMLVYLVLMVFMIPLERIYFNIFSISGSIAGHTFQSVTYGLAIWLVVLFLRRKEKPYFIKTPLNRPILVYLLICLFSLITSFNLYASLEELWHILYYFVWFYLIVNFIKKDKHINWMIIALLLGSIYISLYGLHNFFVLDKRATGLGGSQRLGVYFAMTVPLILGQALWGRSLRWRLSFGLGALLMVATVPFTCARGPWIGLLAAMLFMGFLRDRRILIIILAALMIFPVLLPGHFKLRIEQSVSPEQSQVERVRDWQIALRMIKDYPFSGIGLGDAYQTMYPRYKPGHEFSRPHSLYLYQAVALGIPGLIVYLWLIITLFWKGLNFVKGQNEQPQGVRAKRFFRVKPADFRSDLLLSILCGLVGILIASITDEHFHASEVAMTFWLLIGLGVTLMRR